jgi:hypothetical protein
MQSMAERAQPIPHKYELEVSAGPFREPGKDILSYDYFVNRKGWVIPRVMRVFVDCKAELEVFQNILGVSGGSPGQQLKVTQMLTRVIADQKAAIVLEEGRIETASEVLVNTFTGNDAYLFDRLQAWMMDQKEKIRQEIRTKAGI